MGKKIGVIGSERVDIAQALARHGELSDDVRGADVVVLAGDADLGAIARSAPAAVVVVTGGDLAERCQEVYEATLFPRARIVGTAEPAGAVESIVFEREEDHEVIAMTDGEFGPRRARLGRGGIRALL